MQCSVYTSMLYPTDFSSRLDSESTFFLTCKRTKFFAVFLSPFRKNARTVSQFIPPLSISDLPYLLLINNPVIVS